MANTRLAAAVAQLFRVPNADWQECTEECAGSQMNDGGRTPSHSTAYRHPYPRSSQDYLTLERGVEAGSVGSVTLDTFGPVTPPCNYLM